MNNVAVMGGLGAAACWGLQHALSSRAARRSHPLNALLGVLVVGLVTAIPVAALQGLPKGTRPSDWGFALLAAAGDVCGLGLIFLAFRKGPLALVAPIASAQGAAATIIAVLVGEPLLAGHVIGLTAVLGGMIVVLSHQRRRRDEPAGEERFTSAMLALGSCVAIGVALFALSQSSSDLGVWWTIVVLRTGGIVLLAGGLASKGLLARPRESYGLVLPAGIIDNLGFASFLAGTASGSIAIPAVLGSQFSVVAALIGLAVFGERLAHIQILGLGVIVAGVAILAAQPG